MICIYRCCTDSWRRRHEYKYADQYEVYEQSLPPDYHNFSNISQANNHANEPSERTELIVDEVDRR